MKQLISRIFVIGAILVSTSLIGQNFKMSKSYDQSFSLGNETEVTINNKYGDIQVLHWDRDSVRIQVKVEVASPKESKTQKIFESIKVSFKTNNFYILAKTELLGKSSFWNDISDKTKHIFNSKTTSRIDYIIHLPKTAHLIIQNKYGSIYMGDYEGKLEVESSNGDFKAHDLSGKTRLNIRFGDIYINKIERGILESSYAEAEIEEIVFLETNTKSSKLYLEKVKELQINSSHDKYHITSLERINGNSNFTFLKIKSLEQYIELNQKYGSLHFRNLGDQIDYFKLDTYKTDIHLSLTYSHSYLINFTTKEPPQIQYPTGDYKKSEVIVNEEEGLKKIQIQWGDTSNEQTLPIKIKAEEGNIFINVK